MLTTTRPVIVTESHAYVDGRAVDTGDKLVEQTLVKKGYQSDEIPEICGFDSTCR